MATADAGSFRDPTNRVFLAGDRVFRGLDAVAAADFDALARSSFFARETTAGRLIGTRPIERPPALPRQHDWQKVLEHDPVPVVSYAYEWPFSMLKDAALLELELTLAALGEGMITKDATPFNVQFVGARPVHIDIGSFERFAPGEPWFGHRQFSQQFLHPLVLSAYRRIPHQAGLRGSLSGITAADCAAALGRDALRPSLAFHIGLHARAERRRSADDRDVRGELKAAGYGPKIIESQVRKLHRMVDALEWNEDSSVWSDYSARGHYADEDLRSKAAFVQHVAEQRRRRQVLDLGANDGRFSELMLPTSEYVVAVDHDPLVVERLYRRLRDRSAAKILPLVIDLADPPGGQGWRNRERASFVQRVRPDLVLCLALIHHLVISASIPVEEVLDFLLGFGAELVLEYPDPGDEKVEVLLRQKKDPDTMRRRYSAERFEAAFAERFETVRRKRIGSRTLFHGRPRRRPGPSEDRSAVPFTG